MQQSFARFIPCAYTRTLLFAHLRCSRARGGHGGSSSRWSRLAGATKDTTAASSAPPSHRGRPELGCTAGAATHRGVGAFPAGPAGRLLPGPPGGAFGGRCARRYRRLETPDDGWCRRQRPRSPFGAPRSALRRTGGVLTAQSPRQRHSVALRAATARASPAQSRATAIRSAILKSAAETRRRQILSLHTARSTRRIEPSASQPPAKGRMWRAARARPNV